MENDTTLTAMENELNEIQNLLDGCEKALKTDMERTMSGYAKKPVKEEEKENRPISDAKANAAMKELSLQISDIRRRLEQLEEIHGKLEMLDEMDEDLNYIKNFLNTKLNKDFDAMYHNTLEQMNIEAIKIYRNIQAVIVEEDAKQNHVLFGVDGKSDKLKFRMNHVMIFSIISFVVSILVMILQILPAFGIDLF